MIIRSREFKNNIIPKPHKFFFRKNYAVNKFRALSVSRKLKNSPRTPAMSKSPKPVFIIESYLSQSTIQSKRSQFSSPIRTPPLITSPYKSTYTSSIALANDTANKSSKAVPTSSFPLTQSNPQIRHKIKRIITTIIPC